MEKIGDGTWRLELYPDALFVKDPFAQKLNYQSVASRLVWRTWPMQISLPDLGADFRVTPLNRDNAHRAQANLGRFMVRPGVYLLSRDGTRAEDRAPLPSRVGQVGIDEFVCPAPVTFSPEVILPAQRQYITGMETVIDLEVVVPAAPAAVRLQMRGKAETDFRDYPMIPLRGYTYRAIVAPDQLPLGDIQFQVSVDGQVLLPSGDQTWSATGVTPSQPIRLFTAARDGGKFLALRTSGDQRSRYAKVIPADGPTPPALRVFTPAPDSVIPHTISVPIKSLVRSRGTTGPSPTKLRVTGRAHQAGSLQVTLLEADGTAWVGRAILSSEWSSTDVALNTLTAGRGIKLPLGYPGNWNIDLPPLASRGHVADKLNFDQLEHVQLTAIASSATTAESSIDIGTIDLIFE